MVLREGQSDSDVGGWEVMVVKVKAEKQRALSDTLLETILRNLIKQIKYKKATLTKHVKEKLEKKNLKFKNFENCMRYEVSSIRNHCLKESMPKMCIVLDRFVWCWLLIMLQISHKV